MAELRVHLHRAHRHVDERGEAGGRLERRVRDHERLVGRCVRLHRRAQQLARAAAENHVVRVDAVHFRQRSNELVLCLHRIAIGVAECRADRVERLGAGTHRILVAVEADHPRSRREQPVGSALIHALARIQTLASAIADERDGRKRGEREDTGAAGAKRREECATGHGHGSLL